MTISVETILSSHVPTSKLGAGRTITTLLVTYPLWIHAQMRAHRKVRTDDTGDCLSHGEYHLSPGVMECENLSRNASSNRAVPTTRLMSEVALNPAMPNFFGAERKGMQATELCDNLVMINGESYLPGEAWQYACAEMLKIAGAFATAGYHKQVVNRLLMPWQHITVVMTTDDWSGFLAQRLHADADPTMMELARLISTELEKPAMQTLTDGQVHLPFVIREDWIAAIAALGLATSDEQIDRYATAEWNVLSCAARNELSNAKPQQRELSWTQETIHTQMLRLSVARCASASYNTVDGYRMDAARADALYMRLVGADPMHMSPTEHQAVAINSGESGLNGNLSPMFVQFRKLIEANPVLWAV